ncbi:MAG: AtpZ/AtpI family protein [Thermoleophilaceae bacterium]|nr:AtpZ/AtpI family protein [Thermoleophilaceae bacterium]
MNDRSPNAAAGAGILLVTTIVVCAAIGYGLGALVGVPGVLAGVGGFLGIVAGFALVYSRFKDL